MSLNTIRLCAFARTVTIRARIAKSLSITLCRNHVPATATRGGRSGHLLLSKWRLIMTSQSFRRSNGSLELAVRRRLHVDTDADNNARGYVCWTRETGNVVVTKLTLDNVGSLCKLRDCKICEIFHITWTYQLTVDSFDHLINAIGSRKISIKHLKISIYWPSLIPLTRISYSLVYLLGLAFMALH